MRSIHETRDFLKNTFEVISERLLVLEQEGAGERRVEREKRRQERIAEVLRAVEEVQAQGN